MFEKAKKPIARALIVASLGGVAAGAARAGNKAPVKNSSEVYAKAYEHQQPQVFLAAFDKKLNGLKESAESNHKTFKITPKNLRSLSPNQQTYNIVKDVYKDLKETLIIYAPNKQKPGTFTQLSIGVGKDGHVVNASIGDGFKNTHPLDISNLSHIEPRYIFSQSSNGGYTPVRAWLRQSVPLPNTSNPADVLDTINNHTFTIGDFSDTAVPTFGYTKDPSKVASVYTGFLHQAQAIEDHAVPAAR